MPLKISNPAKEAAVLNRWADSIENQLRKIATPLPNYHPSIPAVVPTPAPAPAVGDGLIHGDVVWEHDSAYSEWRDDFKNTFNVSPAVTIGETGWFPLPFGSSTFGSGFIAGAPPNLGVYEIRMPGSTANYGASVTHASDQINGGTQYFSSRMALLDNPGWKCTYVFCLRRPLFNNSLTTSLAFDITKMSMYVGLGNGQGGTPGTTPFAVRPQQFIGVRYDTDTTAPSIADTTFHLEACLNTLSTTTTTRFNNTGTNGGDANTGITPVEGVFYRLDIVCITTGILVLSLSGGGSTFETTFTLTPVTETLSAGYCVFGAGILSVQGGYPVDTTNLNGYIGFASGSSVVLTDPPNNNGTYIVANYPGSDPPLRLYSASGTTDGTTRLVTLVGYPGLIPVFSFANDSQGSAPVANTRALGVDFFSLVWNKGLTSSTTTTPTKSRYW